MVRADDIWGSGPTDDPTSESGALGVVGVIGRDDGSVARARATAGKTGDDGCSGGETEGILEETAADADRVSWIDKFAVDLMLLAGRFKWLGPGGRRSCPR